MIRWLKKVVVFAAVFFGVIMCVGPVLPDEATMFPAFLLALAAACSVGNVPGERPRPNRFLDSACWIPAFLFAFIALSLWLTGFSWRVAAGVTAAGVAWGAMAYATHQPRGGGRGFMVLPPPAGTPAGAAEPPPASRRA